MLYSIYDIQDMVYSVVSCGEQIKAYENWTQARQAFAWLFAFALGKKLLLWAFWCRKFLEGKKLLEGKITEGKRITKGKLLKGKEWLKRG
jgi:hypothetical protein